MTDSAIDQEVEPISEALLSQGYALLRYLELANKRSNSKLRRSNCNGRLRVPKNGKCDPLRAMIEQHEQFGTVSPLPTSSVQIPRAFDQSKPTRDDEAGRDNQVGQVVEFG